MFGKLIKPFIPGVKGAPGVKGSAGVAVDPPTDSQVKCTYCGGTKFYGGPEAGAAQNILCANDSCRHWFNLSPFGLDDLHKVEPTPDEAAKAAAERKAQEEIADRAVVDQGRDAYLSGATPYSLLQGKSWYAEALRKEQALLLAGFMEAMADDVRGLRTGKGAL